ncbi:hypothetical protein SDRG_08118 [Saprolegnia diclina VS20]|uniref:Uncharacterized protein n=1 Tax=Saprolegnia diclina (strain VS20) TaxID=1156394 RepID=T0QHX0_SAPDV|nr:hypothetical protein SDRG_08118 [Saprolegnia diclina VS20]EQC34346.1 hypothetical protein SDRG_08118 [Saprolegnia diclina VS20]|eukprot:XP_008612208.1 hypothetical protein SDRG_08118 [Saprolegnia diclina VS20]
MGKDATVFAEAEARDAAVKRAEEERRALDGYTFIPQPLRRHFKRARSSNQADALVSSDPRAITLARYARTARLLQHATPELHAHLYPSEVEDFICTQVSYERALAKLLLLEQGGASWTVVQLQRQVINLVDTCLKGLCDVYLGLLQPKRAALVYTAASPLSGMLAKSLPSGKGISFRAIDDDNIVVCDDIATDDAIESFGPHRCGPFAALPLPGRLRGSRSPIGVLAVDATRGAWQSHPGAMTLHDVLAFLRAYGLDDVVPSFQKHKIDGPSLLALKDLNLEFTLGIYRVHTRTKLLSLIEGLNAGLPLHLPETPTRFVDAPETMQFLTRVADIAGPLFATARRREWHARLCDATKDGTCTQYDLYYLVIQALLHCVLNVTGVAIWRVLLSPMELLKSNVVLLGACDVPSDRLAPFVHCSEKAIKRVPLFTETSTSLLRGNVVHVVPALGPKEATTYTVSWSNHVVEDVNWHTMSRLLPVRLLNTQHFHLQGVLAGMDVNSGDFLVPFPAQSTKVWVQPFADEPKFKYVIVTTLHEAADISDAVSYLSQLLPELDTTLRCVRGRQKRHLQRTEAVARLRQWTAALAMTPSPDALRSLDELLSRMVNEVQLCLPGTQSAIWELTPSAKSLRCTFAYHGCARLIGLEVDVHAAGIADCLSAKAPVVLRSASRLSFLPDETMLPVVLLPLLHDDALVGVLVVFDFRSVEKGRSDETHPEYGVIPMLEVAARGMAAALRLKRRAARLFALANIVDADAFAAPAQVFASALQCLQSSLLGVLKARLLVIRKSDGKPTVVADTNDVAHWPVLDLTYVEGARGRLRELRWPTFQTYHKLDNATLDAVVTRVTSTPSLLSKSLCSADVQYVETLAEPPVPIEWTKNLRKTLESANQVIFGNQKYLSTLVPALCTSTHVVALTAALPSPYCFAAEPAFLETVARTLSGGIECLAGRYDRVRARAASLDALDAFVAAHKTIALPLNSPYAEQSAEVRLDLQHKTLSLLQSTLTGCHAYVGLRQPAFHRIVFTAASSTSHMLGKQLVRGKKGGVGFEVIASQSPVVLTQVSQLHVVRHFGRPEALVLPYMAVPIGTFGVLALDDLSAYGPREPQPEMGVEDFLVRFGQMLATGLEATRTQTAAYRAQLRERGVQSALVLSDNARPTEHDAQAACLALVQAAFTGTKGFVAMAMPFSNEMRVTKASESPLVDTIDASSPLFAAFQHQSPVVVARVEDDAEIARIVSDQKGAFVAVPIPLLGVLAVTSFTGAAGGPYTATIPEAGTVSCLQTIGAHLGSLLRAKRLQESQRVLSSVFLGNISSFQTLFSTISGELARNIPSAIRIDVWYIFEGDHPPLPQFTASSHIHATSPSLRPDDVVQMRAVVSPESIPETNALLLPLAMHDPYVVGPQVVKSVLKVTRLPGVDWPYDLDVLKRLQPLIDNALTLASHRAAANVARQKALVRLDAIRDDTLTLPSHDAYTNLHATQDTCLNAIADALGAGTDVYLAYLEPRFTEFATRDVDGLVFRSASRESLMRNVVLDTEDLLSFQCLRTQEPIVINHLSAQTGKTVHFCTSRRATRAYVVVPLSTLGVLAVDSFGVHCFTTKNELEKDVLSFLRDASQRLVALYEDTHQRYSRDRIVSVGSDLQALYAETLAAAYRDVTHVHSGHVLGLAPDFTGDLEVLCWLKYRNRRPVKAPRHYCYEQRCRKHYVRDLIHYDCIRLPMTNCPRTLDDARSTAPDPILAATGLEVRGNYPTFAAMMDGKMVAPRIAFVLYRKAGRSFTERDTASLRRLLTTAQDAYVAAFTALVLESLSIEMLFFAREMLQARDGFVARGSPLPILAMSTNETKYPLGPLKKAKKQTTRLIAFAATDVPVAVATILPAVVAVATPAPTTTTTVPPPEATVPPAKASKLTTRFRPKSKPTLAPTPAAVAAVTETPPSAVHHEVLLRLPHHEFLLLDVFVVPGILDNASSVARTTMVDWIETASATALRFREKPAGNERTVGYLLDMWFQASRTTYGATRLGIEHEARVHLDALVAVPPTPCPEAIGTVFTAALVACGVKRDVITTPRVALELFLSKKAATFLFESDPFDPKLKSRVWTSAFKCRTFLTSFSLLQLLPQLSPPLNTLLRYLLLLIAVARFLKRDADDAKAKRAHLSAAAIVLQCRVRCIFAGRELARRRRRRDAAICLQSVGRMYLARQKVLRLRSNQAASRLQTWWRRLQGPKKTTALSTKHLLDHVHALQARYATVDSETATTDDVSAWGDISTTESFDAFLASRHGKAMLTKEERGLSARMKARVKARSELPLEARLQEEVQDLFDFFDPIGVGSISRDDTKVVIAKLRIPLVDDELDDVVSMIDNDKSGDVSVLEFCSWFLYEYPTLRKRSADCGSLSRADRDWFVHTMAKRFLQQKYNIQRARTAVTKPNHDD